MKRQERFDRRSLAFHPLRERSNAVRFPADAVRTSDAPRDLTPEVREVIEETAARIVVARKAGVAVVLAFGAHTIKNGLAPVLIDLISEGWVTHLATNGAGVIHDWEIAFQGGTSEDVRANIGEGRFGMWEETGRNINIAIAAGARLGLGYGESVGSFIQNDGVDVPDVGELKSEVVQYLDSDPDRSAAAADLADVARRLSLPAGRLAVEHRFKQYSVQAAAWRLGVPFTGHPMIGHDVIYGHPANSGGAIGRAGVRDFLSFASSVSRMDGGVYLSVGSAIMSPMIFEKSFSMSRNAGRRRAGEKANVFITVVDLAPIRAEWTRGGVEPPKTDPAYYVRYLKTFNRVGGTLRYACADNRDFLLALAHSLAAAH